MTDFTHRIHSEKGVDGFTALDGTVKFYGFVHAILLKTGARQVLDFGAGRGAALVDDRSVYRRHLRDLRVGARRSQPATWTKSSRHIPPRTARW